MEKNSFSFKIGNFKCMAVSDGIHTYEEPSSLLFPAADKVELEGVLGKHNLQPGDWPEWKSSYTCLVVNTGQRLVLVDTGAGTILGPETGRLALNLETVGINPGDIDTVIITHAHPDHIGGSTIDGEEVAFPNANFFIMKEEWDFWTSVRAEKDLSELPLEEDFRQAIISIARDNLHAIEGQLELIDSEREIVPGIMAVLTPGHTPGHMMPVISSLEEELFCISDALVHPIHIVKPQWHMAADLNPKQNILTRREILNMATEREVLIHAFHFPFPGIGQVSWDNGSWQWKPILTVSA